MNITAIRVGKTFNTGNYTSHKVEIEAIPDNGQSFEDAMEQINAIVDAQNPGNAGATTKPKPAAKPASSAPPLANKGVKSEKADPSVSPPVPADTQPATPPFEPGSKVAAEPKPKAKRGRPAKVPDHEKEVAFTLESQTLEELFERFCNLRTFADAFGSVENWAGACRQVQARRKELETELSDKAVLGEINAALTSESTAIAERRNAELTEAAA